jgi:hypothetical protein
MRPAIRTPVRGKPIAWNVGRSRTAFSADGGATARRACTAFLAVSNLVGFLSPLIEPRQRGLQRDAGGPPPWRARCWGEATSARKGQKSLPRQK